MAPPAPPEAASLEKGVQSFLLQQQASGPRFQANDKPVLFRDFTVTQPDFLCLAHLTQLFFFINFIYLWLHWVFLLLIALASLVEERRLSECGLQ